MTTKNGAAVSLGKLRWAGKSKADKSAHAAKMLTARWGSPSKKARKQGSK